MIATYANPETGELTGPRDVKLAATEAATALVDAVWAEISAEYNVGALTSLKITEKIVNALLSGAVKEHVEILAEPLKPRQNRLPGVD